MVIAAGLAAWRFGLLALFTCSIRNDGRGGPHDQPLKEYFRDFVRTTAGVCRARNNHNNGYEDGRSFPGPGPTRYTCLYNHGR